MVTASVALDAFGTMTNRGVVSGGGDTNPGNGSGTSPIPVEPLPVPTLPVAFLLGLMAVLLAIAMSALRGRRFQPGGGPRFPASPELAAIAAASLLTLDARQRATAGTGADQSDRADAAHRGAAPDGSRRPGRRRTQSARARAAAPEDGRAGRIDLELHQSQHPAGAGVARRRSVLHEVRRRPGHSRHLLGQGPGRRPAGGARHHQQHARQAARPARGDDRAQVAHRRHRRSRDDDGHSGVLADEAAGRAARRAGERRRIATTTPTGRGASAAIRRPAPKRTCSAIPARATTASTSSCTSSRTRSWAAASVTSIRRCTPRSARPTRPRWPPASTCIPARKRKHYATTNAGEYWAEGVQWWFFSNFGECFDGGVRVDTPEEFAAYDPALNELISRVFDSHRIPMDVFHGGRVTDSNGRHPA